MIGLGPIKITLYVYNAYVDVQQYSSHDIWSRRLMSGVWWARFNFGSNTIPAQQKPSLGTFTFPIHVHHFGGYIRFNQQLSLFNSMIIVDSFGFVQHMVIFHCGLAPLMSSWETQYIGCNFRYISKQAFKSGRSVCLATDDYSFDSILNVCQDSQKLGLKIGHQQLFVVVSNFSWCGTFQHNQVIKKGKSWDYKLGNKSFSISKFRAPVNKA